MLHSDFTDGNFYNAAEKKLAQIARKKQYDFEEWLELMLSPWSKKHCSSNEPN